MEQHYLLMHRTTAGGLDQVHYWAAAEVPDVGKVLTGEQAEQHAELMWPPAEAWEAPGPRFLLALTPDSQQFAEDEAPPLATLPGETVWSYGEPTRADMLAILRAAAGDGIPGGATLSPTPGMTAVAARHIVTRACNVFGPHDPHDIEARFDRLMLDIGGLRHGDAAFYQVPLGALGIG